MTLNREVPGFIRRVAAFALDYLLIAGYLVVIAIVGSILTFGPLKDGWQRLISSPERMDFLAFVTAILPVILYFTLMESSEGGATWGKRRMRLRVVHMSGERLSRGRALVRSAVKFLPWQLAHTGLFHIPGWPRGAQEPPIWVIAGLVLAWVAVGFYIVTLAVGPSRRTPYDWFAGSRVVRSKMDNTPKKNMGLATGLGVLQVFIGLGAVAGGLGLILEPSGSSLGLPLEMLKSTPFSSFLVPGIVLLIVNGFGSLVGAAASFKRYWCAGELALALGLFLVAWIMIQVYWFAGYHWLHVMYFSIGLLELILGWMLRKALRREKDE